MKIVVEEEDNVKNDCVEKIDKLNKVLNLNEEKGKSLDNVCFIEIMLKECGKELIEKVSTDNVLEDEVDNFLEEKDFF